MRIYPLHPHPVLLLEDIEKKYLVVTDLHLGFEEKLTSKGITIKSDIVAEMRDEIIELVDLQCADGLILLGDIKHSIATISRHEWDVIPAFLKDISSKTEIYFVPGNHDSNISHMLPSEINTVSNKGMILSDTLLLHGHSLPSNIGLDINRIVMGHIHPVFLKHDSVINGMRVWIYLQTKKEIFFRKQGMLDLIVMPSFNPYLYATRQYSQSHRSISPIIKRIMENERSVHKCIITMLDGSIVGDATALQHIL